MLSHFHAIRIGGFEKIFKSKTQNYLCSLTLDKLESWIDPALMEESSILFLREGMKEIFFSCSQMWVCTFYLANSGQVTQIRAFMYLILRRTTSCVWGFGVFILSRRSKTTDLMYVQKGGGLFTNQKKEIQKTDNARIIFTE